ncbi:MAG TPA: carbamoyltransferase C-terminal domain-containing protein [Bryobacteraceae bacterium]|nr:carbamoyltransferase C-terminal domain-containing protein [Bryobacteraceae bacterium]
MVILGLGGILNDAACALLVDGKLVAAAEEEKLARRHTPGELPDAAIDACLRMAGLSPDQVDCVAIVRPFPTETGGLHVRLRSQFPNGRFVLVEHHAAHAAAAYFPSSFEEAVVLTLDRAGDFRCGARWEARGIDLQLDKELYVPDSLGEVFSRTAELLGFEAGADEHKVQWMSTAGDDRYVELFDRILGGDGDWPKVDRSWFQTDSGSPTGWSERIHTTLGTNPGVPIPESLATHVAAGVQRATERAVVRMARGAKRLCLGGGLGLNALLVAALEREFEVFVQPAAGNSGTALGAVLWAWHVIYRQTARVSVGDLCLGPEWSVQETKKVLENCKLRFKLLTTSGEVVDTAVEQLSENRIVAWMHGRMEFGPRALGNRSILASPLDPYSTENLNVFIKHREQFRKFAASVPAELASEYFEAGPNARYLATVGRVRPHHRGTFQPAILGSDRIRVHTVTREDNPLYHRLLHAAGARTGLPVLYNTSFNLFGDPLVCTPRDAARSFYSSGIDAMFVGQFFLQK